MSGKTILKCNKAFGGRLAAQGELRAKAIEERLAGMKGLLAELEKQKDAIEEKAESIQKDLAKDLEKLEDTAKSMGEEGVVQYYVDRLCSSGEKKKFN